MAGQIERVGFVGLGIMGGAMMRNTAAAGYAICGYDPSEVAMEGLASQKGTPASCPREVAESSDVVVTSLAQEVAFETVVHAVDGLCAANSGARIVIDTSTLSLPVKQRAHAALQAAGIALIDCPVSGTGSHAVSKQITAFVSGDATAAERCRPVIDAFTRAQTWLGEFGNGTRMKFLANYLVNIHGAAAAEAMALGVKAGLDPQMIYDTLCNSAATSRIFEVRGPLMIEGNYEPPTARIDMFLKDLAIIGDFADSLRAPSWLFSAARQYYSAAAAVGMGQKDVAAIFDVCRHLSGIGEGGE